MVNLVRFWILVLALGFAGATVLQLLGPPSKISGTTAADKQADSHANPNTPAQPVSATPAGAGSPNPANAEIPSQPHNPNQAYLNRTRNQWRPEELSRGLGDDLIRTLGSSNVQLYGRAPGAAEMDEFGESGRAMELASRLFSVTATSQGSGQYQTAPSPSSAAIADVARVQTYGSMPATRAPQGAAPDGSGSPNLANAESPSQIHNPDRTNYDATRNQLPLNDLSRALGEDLTQRLDGNIQLYERDHAAETGEFGEAGRAIELAGGLFSGTPISQGSGQYHTAQSTFSATIADVARAQANASVSETTAPQEAPRSEHAEQRHLNLGRSRTKSLIVSQAGMDTPKQQLVIHVPPGFSAAQMEVIKKRVGTKLGTRFGYLQVENGGRPSGATALIHYYSPESRDEARAVAKILGEIGYHWRVKSYPESSTELIEVWIPPNRAR